MRTSCLPEVDVLPCRLPERCLMRIIRLLPPDRFLARGPPFRARSSRETASGRTAPSSDLREPFPLRPPVVRSFQMESPMRTTAGFALAVGVSFGGARRGGEERARRSEDRDGGPDGAPDRHRSRPAGPQAHEE